MDIRKVAITVLLIIVMAESIYIALQRSEISTVQDTEQASRDSLDLISQKYDSIQVAKQLKDSLYEALQQSKPAVEYYAKERIVYLNKSNADTLDKFIRSNWSK